MTYPPMPGVPGGQDPATVAVATAQRRNSRRLTILLAALVAVLAVVVALVANQVYFNKTGKPLIPGLTLRAADQVGEDPFVDSVSLAHNVGPLQNRVQSAEEHGVRVVNGTTPGLYAVTGSPACDTAALGNQLAANPAAAQAWASVFGIRAGDIPWYLNTLTPVVLTADTWVTNHSYTGGRARPFQSVLQAGTPVYVDALGVPRAVCACGNPLRPPAAAPIGGYRVVGHPWPAYQVNNTTRIATSNVTVHNTTIVNQPQPVAVDAGAVLQVLQLATQVIAPVVVGDLLEGLPEAPADLVLPSPAELNVPLVIEDADDAARVGLQVNSAEPAEVVVERDEDTGGDPFAPVEEETTEQQDPAATDAESADPADEQSVTSDAQAAPSESTTSSSTTSSSEAPSPTVFTLTGDAIGTLTYKDGDDEMRCTLPSTFDGPTVTATDCELTFDADDLRAVEVNRIVDADRDRVWRITPVGRTPIEIVSAEWQTLTTPTNETTTEAPAETTPETTETTPEATEEPAPETTKATTSAAVPDVSETPAG